MQDKIYQMKLHETIRMGDKGFDALITRVAGGWLYTMEIGGNYIGTTTFVRFDNEFMILEEKTND